jgi:hypothetical protein
MSKDTELGPNDYHVAVRRREHSATPWRWEIWAAGKTKACDQSAVHYASMSEAMREGKAALRSLIESLSKSAA